MKLSNLFRKKEPKPTWQEKLFSPDLAKWSLPDFNRYPKYRVDQLEKLPFQKKFSYKKVQPGTFLWFKYDNKYVIGRLLVSVYHLKKAGINCNIEGPFDTCHFIFFKGAYESLDEIKVLEPIAAGQGLEPSIYKVDPQEDYEIGEFGYLDLKPEDLIFKESLFFYHKSEWHNFNGQDRIFRRVKYTCGELSIDLPFLDISRGEGTIWGYEEADSQNYIFAEDKIYGIVSGGYPFELNGILNQIQNLASVELDSNGYLLDWKQVCELGFEYQPNLRKLIYELIGRPLDMGYYEFAKLQGVDPSKFIYT